MAYEELGQNPISPDQPAGTDARYEPEFEQLQAEIDKLSSPSATGGVDWKKATELSATILSQKSKDLLAASYLSVALLQTAQVEGLAQGFSVLEGILANFWEDLFPKKKRMRGRIAAIEWWIEKTQTALESGKFQPVPEETVEGIKEKLSKIDERLVEVLPDPPLLRPLQKKIEALPVIKAAPSQPPAEAEKNAASSAPPAAAQAAASPKTSAEPAKKVASATDAIAEITKQLRRLRELSSSLLSFDISNALAYRCRRTAAWALMDRLPKAKDGVTQFSAPPPNVAKDIQTAMDESEWEQVIRLAEDSLPRYNLWMDLNRFTAQALLNLGEKHQAAHQAVCIETASFCSRLSGIETLQFSDGTPFADSATQKWLSQLVSQSGASSSKQAPPSETGAGNSYIEETLRQARALAKKRKMNDAIQMIHDERMRSTSMKAKHQWTQGMCRILLESKKTRLALPFLETIVNDIDQYELSLWDPELAVEGLKLVLKGYGSLPDKTYKEKSEDALDRIARLDPVEALSLSK